MNLLLLSQSLLECWPLMSSLKLNNFQTIANMKNSFLFDSTIGCEYNGECLEKNEKRFDKSSCTNFVCAFSKKQNRLVLKERIAGITEYYHSSIEVRKICLIFISFYILVYQKKYKKVVCYFSDEKTFKLYLRYINMLK